MNNSTLVITETLSQRNMNPHPRQISFLARALKLTFLKHRPRSTKSNVSVTSLQRSTGPAPPTAIFHTAVTPLVTLIYVSLHHPHLHSSGFSNVVEQKSLLAKSETLITESITKHSVWKHKMFVMPVINVSLLPREKLSSGMRSDVKPGHNYSLIKFVL